MGAKQITLMCRSVDYVALLVDVWLFMVLPTVFALTKSILPISQGGAPSPPSSVCVMHRRLLVI